MRVLWILLMLGMTQGEENLEFDTSETTIFIASIECSPTYTTTDKIECEFHLKNDDKRDYSVLRWRTPLDGMTSDCLVVTRNGKKLQYDGIYKKRTPPGPHQFLPIGAGETLSSTFYLSHAYDVTKAGTYSIAMDTYLEYVEGSVTRKPDMQTKIIHLSSPAVSFQLVGTSSSKRTLGQRARSHERRNRPTGNDFSKGTFGVGVYQKRGQILNTLRNPNIRRGSKTQRKATNRAHQAAYDHMKSAILNLQNKKKRVKAWFGVSRGRDAIKVFRDVREILGRDTITYVFGGKYCDSETYGYTYKGSRQIFLCKSYQRAKTLSGFDNKMGILTHELSHALAHTDDRVYGQSACKQLAKKAPHLAVRNADNYEYFVETL